MTDRDLLYGGVSALLPGPPPPADFTPAQRQALAQAQEALLRKRQARAAEQLRQAAPDSSWSFAQTLGREASQPCLLTTHSLDLRPPQKAFTAEIYTSSAQLIEQAAAATIERIKPGSPHARALVALAAAEATLQAKVRPRALHRARRVLQALYEAVYTLIRQRGQSRHTTSYTFFTVLDVLPLVTGLAARTCERATSDLRAAGILATWSAWDSSRFLDRATGELVEKRVRTGVWLAVQLRPRPGQRAMIFPAELPADPPRDLTADRRCGNTAWQLRKEVAESVSNRVEKMEIGSLLQWSVRSDEVYILGGSKDSATSPTLTSLAAATSAQEIVWSLGALLSEQPQLRQEAVQAAATALVRVFRDPAFLKHYYRVLWRTTQAELNGYPALMQLQQAMGRTLVAMRELNLRKPGAYLIRLLQDGAWWDAVYRAPVSLVWQRAG